MFRGDLIITTVAVAGSATLNANFAKDKYSVTKSPDANCSLTTNATSVEWGSSVTGTATPASGYKISSITATYVDDEDATQSVTVNYTAGTGPLNYSFTMPTANVTVTATSTLLPSNTINYGVCSGQSAYGYVNVGEYHNSASTIKYTIDTNTKVLEGTKVNFCARPAVGYVFVGWYDTSASTGGNLISSSQDYTKTSPSGNYYARFRAGKDDAYESTKHRLLFKKSDYSNTDYKIYAWSGISTASYPGTKINTLSTVTNGAGTEYYYVEASSTINYLICNAGDSDKTGNKSSSAGTKVIAYTGNGDTGYSATSYTQTKDGATTAYFPVKYYITNKDKGNMSSTTPMLLYSQVELQPFMRQRQIHLTGSIKERQQALRRTTQIARQLLHPLQDRCRPVIHRLIPRQQPLLLSKRIITP